jgi:chromosome segregation ATPase
MQFHLDKIGAQPCSLALALLLLSNFAMAQVQTTVKREGATESAPVESIEIKSEKTVLEKYRDELLEKIEKLDAKIDQLDALFLEMQKANTEDIRKRIETERNFYERLEILESKIDQKDVGLSARVSRLELQSDEMRSGFDDLENEIRRQDQPLILMRAELSSVQAEVDKLKFNLDELVRLENEQENKTQKRFDDIDSKITVMYESFVKKVDLSNDVAALNVTIQKNEKLIELIRQRIDSLDGFQAQNASEARRLSDESLEIADRLTVLQESSELMKNQISKLNDLDGRVTDFASKLDDLERNKTNVIDWDYERENITSELVIFNEEISRLESVSRDAGYAATAANEELQRVMERINMLELVQPEVEDLKFMKEKLDALEGQFSASDFSKRIMEIEQNLKKLEEKLTSSKVEIPKEKSKVKN